MASKDEDKEADGPSEQAKVDMFLLGRFLDLGFTQSMAEDLVAEKVDWREAERVLKKGPPGGHAWVYWYLMPWGE